MGGVVCDCRPVRLGDPSVVGHRRSKVQATPGV